VRNVAPLEEGSVRLFSSADHDAGEKDL